MKVTLNDALDFVGVDVTNVKRRLKGARTSAIDWLDETNAPPKLIDFVKRFVRLGTNIDIELTDLVILVGAVIYIICPFDLVPDVVPVIGWMDDIAVATLAIASLPTASNETDEE